MAKAQYLTDRYGNEFYPYAHASATYDKNGKTVEERLDEIDKDNGVVYQSEEPTPKDGLSWIG